MTNKFKFLFAMAMAVFATAIVQVARAAPLPAAIKAKGYITIGVNCSYPPAGYVGIDGKPAGYEIAFARRVAEIAFGTPGALHTQCVNDSNRVPFLQSGKIDLILASLAYTPARAESLDYSHPIWVSNLQLVVPEDSKIRDYADLADRTVTTNTGSTYQTWLQKCYPKARLLTSQTAAEGTTMLTQGRTDAFAYIDVYVYNFAKMHKGYKVVGTLAASAIQGVGVRKGDRDMLAWVNGVVDRMRMDDDFFKAFAAEIKDPGFVAKYRSIVPGPGVTLDYAKSGALECLK